MSNRFDATLKDLLTLGPEDFAGVFGIPRVHPSVALNVDLSTISAATDVALGVGDPLREIVDLNFQSGPDAELESRCHLYSAALHYRFAVPVRTVIVLLRPKAESGPLSGKLTYACGTSGVEFRYDVARMWQEPVAPFLQGGPCLLPLAMLCQLPPDRPEDAALRDIVQEIERRLLAECDHAQAARLMTAAYVLTGLRMRAEETAPIFEGVKLMHESSTYQLILDEGAVREAQNILLLQGKNRLGSPNEETVNSLKSIKDLDRLHRMAGVVHSVASWQDLLATW